METVCNKTEGKAKSEMGRRCEEWFEEDGSDQLETNDAGEEEMERNNWASQNPQRDVELKEEDVAVDEQWLYIGCDCACVLGFWGLLRLLMLTEE